MTDRSFPPNAIAIVGLAGRFPGAATLDDFWENIRNGIESLEEFSEADMAEAGVEAALRANSRYVGKGTVLEGSKHWDAAFFGYSPREAQVIDPQQRIFLECAWEAMEHAGYGDRSGHRLVGVYAGSSMNTWLLAKLLRNPEFIASAGGYQLMLGNDKDFLCTRVSYKLDLRGPSMTIQTACSTSLVAVEAACRALTSGECDMALAGGVSITFPEKGGYLHQEGMILSPDGHCRPFDASAGGTRAGAGAGVVVLKRLDDAHRDGDTIHAVIRGIAVNNDGAGKAGYTAPSLEGQVDVIAAAQAIAQADPRSIEYVEAHGTATSLGDPIEVAALTAAFRAGSDETGFCRLGSLKANLGHLDAAAGVAGLIKAVLVLQRREFPPLVNFKTANPALRLDSSPFTASAEAEPWASAGPRRAAVSSFGIGGTNAHAVLEEAPPEPVRSVTKRHQLIVLSARTDAALDQAAERLADHLGKTRQPLADVAWTLQTGRTAFACRRSLVAADASEAVRQLRTASRIPAARHEGGHRPVALLFPGQGSQHAGMGRALYEEEPVYREIVDECSARLLPHLDLDLRNVMHGDDPELIRTTRLAQPALFVSSFALGKLWEARGVKPAAMLGHSIGEYAAAALAGVFTLDDALLVVATRGRLMQSRPAGAMAGVPLPADEVQHLLDDDVEIAAINAPALCTIAGPTAAIERTLRTLASRGVDARQLHTSHAFHSRSMEPILREFEAVVASLSLRAPSTRYVSNLTGTWITDEQARDPSYYARQLRERVRFADGLRTLAADPTLFYLECGPGQVLTQLASATLGASASQLIASSMPRAGASDSAFRTSLEATGKLWRAGAPIRFEALHVSERPRRVPLPGYPFQRQLFDVEPAAASARAVSPNADCRLHFAVPTWMRDPRPNGPLDCAGTWLVCATSPRAVEATVAALLSAGAQAEGVVGFDALSGRLSTREGRGGLAGLMLLDGMDADGGSRLFQQLMQLASVLETFRGPLPLRIVAATRGAAGVLSERSADPRAALPLGPALVLPTESPNLQIRLVDVASDSDGPVADNLVAEARLTDSETITAWRAGRRWLRRLERILPAGDQPPLRDRGVYLITGGSGGIGLVLAEWLAVKTKARLLLTSRSMPSREQLEASNDPRHDTLRETVSRIETCGGEVLLAAADAADPAGMEQAIAAAAERWGPLNGVVHAAGVPGSGKLALRLTAQEIAATLSAKCDGLDVLRRLLGTADLDFVALMGSINGVVGAAGASDYSAANAVLDAFAEFGERPPGWRRVIAIDWGPWRDVGMAHARLQAAGSSAKHRVAPPPISPDQGADAFGMLLAGDVDRVVVTAFDLQDAINSASSTAAGQGAVDFEAARTSVPSTAAHLEANRGSKSLSTDVERQLASIWTELVGVSDLKAEDDFFELGGHSLMATRMLARIEEQFSARLSLRDVFEAPTISALAARISANEPPERVDIEDREEFFL